MGAVQLLVDKATLLPVHVQEQLLDYADFLLERHGIVPAETEEEELDEETKALLQERSADFKANRDKAVSAEKVIQELKAKYQK